MLACPICQQSVVDSRINEHLDSDCRDHVAPVTRNAAHTPNAAQTPHDVKTHSFFAQRARPPSPSPPPVDHRATTPPKRSRDEADDSSASPAAVKRQRRLQAVEDAMPLAERMRPTSLDDVCGQQLVGPGGLLRGMLAQGRLPSMVLWGQPGTGKTTIARLLANAASARFVEINSTSTKLDQVRAIFNDAARDLQRTGRKTILFCDELHRFSKTQQDAFLGPVESGTVTLIAATTENPSFKITAALLSRCRTFTLAALGEADLLLILQRALARTGTASPPSTTSPLGTDSPLSTASPLLDTALLTHIARSAAGDARTALNLLELALALAPDPATTASSLRHALTHTLLYDRSGDNHYNAISALHKSIRGSAPDAALYYLARMLAAGEDPRYIARRLVVVASEDVGLADNSMLPLATACYDACDRLGMPECQIHLAHAVTALSLSKKSTRVYRGMKAAFKALEEPGVKGLAVPRHLCNAPTRMMKDMGVGKGYKYNPDYRGGRVRQEYFPDEMRGRVFLEEGDFGEKVDSELEEEEDVKEEDVVKEEEDIKEEYGEDDDELRPEVDDRIPTSPVLE